MWVSSQIVFPPECTALLKRKGNIKKRKCSSRHRKERLESLTRKGEKGRREEREEDETRRHTAVESSPHQGRDVGYPSFVSKPMKTVVVAGGRRMFLLVQEPTPLLLFLLKMLYPFYFSIPFKGSVLPRDGGFVGVLTFLFLFFFSPF